MATALLLAAVACLVTLHMRSARRERQRRAGFFAQALAVFDTYRVTQEGPRYPILEGRYRDIAVRLEPVIDDLGWRKLPSLWLKATILVEAPARGILDFLVRPQGTEFYSPHNDLPDRLPVPATWPQHGVISTDSNVGTPPLDKITPHIAPLFDDAKTKELVITPQGLRAVYQVDQGSRAEYLVLRQACFATEVLDSALVKRLLDALIALANDLDKPEHTKEAA